MHTNPEVLALLALGESVGSSAERAHADSCPACSEEVAQLARIADVGRSSSVPARLSAPSPEVWARIAAELGFDEARVLAARPQDRAAAVPPTDLSSRRLARSNEASRPTSAGRRLLALAVAAALALVVGVGIGITYEQRVTKPEVRVIASAQLSALPAFPGVSGSAEVTADGRGNRELVISMSSPSPITGKTQVWLMDAQGTPTFMGEMKDGKAAIEIPVGMSLFERPTVDISAEPANDSDPGRNGQTILRGELT